ncbi:type I restriction endonuclease subunit R, EcoR124 family [Sharpea porci]|uniref:type I restriction endonuclease subunit R, EcoR124 family n=1 Tax=Sharpea porci TaxID=2652286 RepID=UPI002A91435A|nr:HsdR family type I site-specific deoxyribonuclease [Sharpea porci]MDY5279534.1 HsdR family type I site-specific deoxyribonuclease [Sharpea porci]
MFIIFWEQRKLVDFCDMFNGDRGVNYPKDADMVTDGIPFVNAGDLQEGKVNLTTANKITREKFEQLGGAKIKRGDILYCLRGTLGKNAFVDNFDEGTVASSLVDIRAKNIYPQYLFTVLNSDIEYRQRILCDEGAAQPNLSATNLANFDIPVPQIEEQRKIGAFFKNLDSLITLHQYKLYMMFYKKGTILTYFWEQRKLENYIIEYHEVTTKNNQYPVLTSSRKGIFLQSEYYAGNQVASEDNTGYNIVPYGYFTYRHMSDDEIFHFNINDIVENGIVSTLYPVFTTNEELDSRYLQYQLNYGREFAKFALLQKQGGSRTYMYLNKLKKLELTIPKSIREQKMISGYLIVIDNLITLHQRKIEYILKGSVYMDYFNKESSFEEAFIAQLQRNGWEKEVIKYPTEQDLIDNWANILYLNNKDQDRLDEYPLVKEEMDQILEQINNLRTPVELNGWINGKTISIIRKNPDDKNHFGTEVSLKIYDRNEIAGGSSRYQIVEQPIFNRNKKISHDRRGDIMLLINGMPVFHLELKRSHVDVMKAANQITEYAHEGVYTGIFSLVQVFFAITPEETLYFANPGPDGMFNKDFYFHWADFNNDPINNWKSIPSTVLAIPMAHELIGFYTVADQADGVLKVMRSYQYYASSKISNRVAKQDWDSGNQLGGYIWHTTGSGKTMTSFKSAQLIANSKAADKVVFLMDRIELGVQSLSEYKNFADKDQSVQGTENTNILISRLKSDNATDTLIVSSIQKMSNIKDDEVGKMRAKDLESIQKKRIVFIIDECHRSTFGEMLSSIKETFPKALFFGFTGTPVFEENQKKLSTTADIFGDELHRYSIADGIRDKNVLGFNPTMVMVYKDKDLRKEVALSEAHASSEEEAMSDEKKKKKYLHYMNGVDVPMAGYRDQSGKYIKGIEDCVDESIWESDAYKNVIVDDIKENWARLSFGNKFHAIFATSSIPDAVAYYRLFKKKAPKLRVTCLFDPNIDHADASKSIQKIEGLEEIVEDYNEKYNLTYTLPQYANFKKDVAARLAHKEPYKRVSPEKQLDLLIVVNQMLTGFDSKWVNTLYLDKILVYENLIQAFSRTNRLFLKDEKPFGSIRYYRMPHTMKKNIENAVQLFSGDKPQGLFADHLPDNIKHMNMYYEDIIHVFEGAGIPELDRLPDDDESKAKFAKQFRLFCNYMQAARIQGFTWKKTEYSTRIDAEDQSEEAFIHLLPTEEKYLILLQRYKELSRGGGDEGDDEPTFTIDPYLSEIDTGIIDNNYMNSRFEKWKKQLVTPGVDPKETEKTLLELHKSFAFLSQENQKYATMFLHDVESGDAHFVEGKQFIDYIIDYANTEKDEQIAKIVEYLGVAEDQLKEIMQANVTEKNLNEFGRFDALKASVNKTKAQIYFSSVEGHRLPPFRVNNKVNDLLTKFVLNGDFDIADPK